MCSWAGRSAGQVCSHGAPCRRAGGAWSAEAGPGVSSETVRSVPDERARARKKAAGGWREAGGPQPGISPGRPEPEPCEVPWARQGSLCTERSGPAVAARVREEKAEAWQTAGTRGGDPVRVVL